MGFVIAFISFLCCAIGFWLGLLYQISTSDYTDEITKLLEKEIEIKKESKK